MKKLILLVLLTISILSGGIYSQEFVSEGIKYSVVNDSTASCDGTINSRDVQIIIKDTVVYDGLKLTVRDIKTNAFIAYNWVEYIYVPNSVTVIGAETFYCLSELDSIRISPNTTHINNQAFSYCRQLKKIISFSESNIEYIGDRAFIDCDMLDVTLPNTIKYMGEYAFNFTSIRHLTIPDGLDYIPEGAFGSCFKMETVDFGSGVETIGKFAFSVCSNIKTVTIPQSVTEIGIGAFGGCLSLESAVFENGIKRICGGAFASTPLKSIHLPNTLEYIGNGAFSDSDISTISIGSNVSDIDYGAFTGMTKCVSINVASDNPLYSSVDGILYNKERTQLVGVPSITAFEIPSFVKTIAPLTFSYSKVESVIIPASVEYIGENAFIGCNELTKIICNSSYPPELGLNVFGDEWDRTVIENATLYVDEGSVTDYTLADQWKEFNISVLVPTHTQYKNATNINVYFSNQSNTLVVDNMYDGIVYIYNQSGHLMYKGVDTRINMSMYKNGLYVVVVKSDGGISKTKIVK